MAFTFKQFSVIDDDASMKVGTDAVLLGAWAGQGMPLHILDIGSGSGLIALMMAQRFPSANIMAIDIHKQSIEQSINNFKASPWKKNLTATLVSFQDHAMKSEIKYDLIVTNPPFFTNSLRPPDPSKKLARHTDTLNYTQIAEGISNILHKKGSFNLILPYENHKLFEKKAIESHLSLTRQLEITPVEGKETNRILSEWKFEKSTTESDALTIRDRDHNYTEAYKKLTEEFYLAL